MTQKIDQFHNSDSAFKVICYFCVLIVFSVIGMCEKFDFVYQCVASTLHSKTKNGTYKYDITNNIFL